VYGFPIHRNLRLAGVPQGVPIYANLVMPVAVVNRLGKQRTMPWLDTVVGAWSQGMGTSSARSSKVQPEHGLASGTTCKG